MKLVNETRAGINVPPLEQEREQTVAEAIAAIDARKKQITHDTGYTEDASAALPVSVDLDTEADLIDRLEEIDPAWRDKYPSVIHAAEDLLPAYEYRARVLPDETDELSFDE